MLTSSKLQKVKDLLIGATQEEIAWIHGYLSALLDRNGVPTALPEGAQSPAMPVGVSKITVAYGTESGNSKKIAMDLAGKAKTKGIQARLVSLDQYRLHDLSREEYFFTVISTQGEGEPPAAAKKFYEHIHLQEAPAQFEICRAGLGRYFLSPVLQGRRRR